MWVQIRKKKNKKGFNQEGGVRNMVKCEVNQINIFIFGDSHIFCNTHKRKAHYPFWSIDYETTEYGKLHYSKRPKMLQNDYKETKKIIYIYNKQIY